MAFEVNVLWSFTEKQLEAFGLIEK